MELLVTYHADGRVERVEVEAPRERQVTPLAFMQRLPAAKQAAIADAALKSPAILLLLLRLAGAQMVDLDDPETVAGVAALRAAGLLTADEAAAVLA